MATHQSSNHGGNVKDPEHDGRLKENREACRTKDTTPGSEARAREHGNAPSSGGGERYGQRHDDGGSRSHAASGSSDDLKSREYRDEKGEVHHHTRTYMEQHGGKK